MASWQRQQLLLIIREALPVERPPTHTALSYLAIHYLLKVIIVEETKKHSINECFNFYNDASVMWFVRWRSFSPGEG
jgi:hypothetical protein